MSLKPYFMASALAQFPKLRTQDFGFESSGYSSDSYNVSPDGKRFLMIRRDPGSVPRQLNVILNRCDELDRLVPAGKNDHCSWYQTWSILNFRAHRRGEIREVFLAKAPRQAVQV